MRRQPKPKRSRLSQDVLPELLRRDDLSPRVRADLKKRTALGRRRYGMALCTHNGRNANRDAYEELLDAVQYLQQVRMEGRLVLVLALPDAIALANQLATAVKS